MADLKISQLTALTGANVVATDVLPIVDVSESTTKKITASELSSYVATTTPAARPLMPSAAYLSGSGLVLSGLGYNNATTPDSPPLSITGDIDIQVKLAMADWTPTASSTGYILSKWAGGSTRSYYLYITTAGLISLTWTPTGSHLDGINATSTVATGIADGATKWIRATMDVDNGSSQRVAKFYTSDDGTTWTQLGSTVTTAGVTSIFDGVDRLIIGGTDANDTPMVGTIYRVIIRNGYDGAGVTVFDADFSTQTADALAFNATSEAGIKADGLVLKGLTGQYASAPDSAALSITGDIDIKVKATVLDWTPAGLNYQFVSKRQDAGNQQSFSFYLGATGTLNLLTSPDGAGASSVIGSSTAATGVADGATKWVRATLDVNDGSGNRVYKFYTSDNGTTWTQLGTTVTTAGTISIFDSTSPLEFGSRNTGVNDKLIGTIHRAIVQSAYDTANNTASLAFDADFDAQAIGTTSFVESSSNAAVVTVSGTNPTVSMITSRYSFGTPNAQSGTVGAFSLTANNDRYHPFVVTKPIVVDMVLMEVTTGPASAATVYFGLYAADNNLQPTGNVLLATDLAVASGAAGVFTKQFTPVTLQAGTYLLATNPSVTMSVRAVASGNVPIASTYGGNGFINTLSRSRTAATFGNNPSEWNAITTNVSVGLLSNALLRWRIA
jgi:hypothetical protein